MTPKQEAALRQAREALQYVYEGANNQGPHTGISWRCASNKIEPVIAAIDEVLSDNALDKMAENARELGLDYEPAQKDYKAFYDGKKWYSVEVEPPCKTGSQCTNKCQQCEHPAQQQEPHGWYIDGYGAVLGASEPKSVRPGEWLPFYTSPQPAQPSKPLTDEEILDMARTFGAQPWPPGSCVAFARAIEAKLKENT